ncbi:MAG: HDOD domain-containing protein [Pseudomonadota bacterium]
MIARQLDKLLRKKTLSCIGVNEDIPGFNISIAGISCILLLEKREQEVSASAEKAQERYSSESLLDDLIDMGVNVDIHYGKIIRQLQNENYIFVDEMDRYASKGLSSVLIRLIDTVYPSMKGFMLVAFFVQTIEEVLSGRKDPQDALEQVTGVLDLKSVKVELSSFPRKDLESFKSILISPLKKIENDNNSSEFSSLYQKRLEKREKTIQYLTQMIKEKGDLPVLPLNDKFIRQKINQTFSSTSEIAEIILSDVGMTVNVLKAMNMGRGGRPVSTISHAIMLMGNEELKKIIDDFVSLETVTDESHRDEIQATYVSAYMSFSITRQVAFKAEIKDTEEMCICSMLHNIGQMIVLYYYPEAHERIKNLMRHKNSNKRKAARQVLGTTYDNIGIHFAEQWRFPFMTVESLRVCYFNRIGKTKENLIINLPFCATELCAFCGGVLNPAQTYRLRELINCLNMFSRDLAALLEKAWTDTLNFSKKQKISIKKRAMAEIAATG